MSNRFSSTVLIAFGALATHAAAAGPVASSRALARGFIGRQADPAGRAGTVKLKEIVVTATQRVEPVQSVPFQVTAMTAHDLTRIDAHNLGDFAAYVPGLITNSGAAPGLIVIRVRRCCLSTSRRDPAA